MTALLFFKITKVIHRTQIPIWGVVPVFLMYVRDFKDELSHTKHNTYYHLYKAFTRLRICKTKFKPFYLRLTKTPEASVESGWHAQGVGVGAYLLIDSWVCLCRNVELILITSSFASYVALAWATSPQMSNIGTQQWRHLFWLTRALHALWRKM